jgi:hypothetical protein
LGSPRWARFVIIILAVITLISIQNSLFFLRHRPVRMRTTSTTRQRILLHTFTLTPIPTLTITTNQNVMLSLITVLIANHDGMPSPKTTTSTLAYENLISAEEGHWHLRINLHHASSPYEVFGPPLPLALSFQTSIPSFLFTTPSLTYHSRAPPQLS